MDSENINEFQEHQWILGNSWILGVPMKSKNIYEILGTSVDSRNINGFQEYQWILGTSMDSRKSMDSRNIYGF